MKLKTIIGNLFAFGVLLIPTIASAVTVVGGVSSNGGGFLGISFGNAIGCSSTICGIGMTFLYLINSVLVPLIFAVSFIVFLYGIATAYILNAGNETERAKGHQLMLWGIIAFAVMISIWGLVNVVSNTFGLSGSGAPMLPQSY